MIAPTLTSHRLTLRMPVAADVEPFTGLFPADRVAAAGVAMPRPDAWRLVATALGHRTARGHGMWTVTLRDEDRPVGMVGCLRLGARPRNEIGWFLCGGATGRGIATEAARMARDWAYARFGWTTAASDIDAQNPAPIRLAERPGARPERRAPHPKGKAPTIVMRRPPARALPE